MVDKTSSTEFPGYSKVYPAPLPGKASTQPDPNSETTPFLQKNESERNTQDNDEDLDNDQSKSFSIHKSTEHCIRRLLRVLILSGFITFILLVFVFGLNDNYVNESYTFSGNKLSIETSGCRILLKSGSNSDVEVHVSSMTFPKWWNATSFYDGDEEDYFKKTDTSLKMLNPNDNEDSCDLELKSASFPDLEIVCEDDECPITQDDEDVVFGGSLDIIHREDAAGNVALKRITAQSLFFNVTGTVSIEQLTSTQGGSIHVKYGDIWIQSQQEANVVWKTQLSSAYQFVAPSAAHVYSPICTTLNVTISDQTFEVNNCNGNSRTCLSAGCSTAYNLDLNVIDGGVYVQLLSEPGTLYSQNSVSWRDDDSLISLGTDIISTTKINDIRDKLDEDVVEDQFVMMTMVGVNHDIGKWLYTTREAYTQFEPWFMQVCSFGILVPKVIPIDIRIVPWNLPYIFSEPLDDEDMVTTLGPLWNLIKEQFGNHPEHFLMWMDGDDDTEDAWYKILQDKHGDLSRERQKITDNLPLLAAITFSVALGIIAGLIVVVICYITLKRYSNSLWEKLNHMNQYMTMHLTINRRKKDDENEKIVEMIEENYEKNQVTPTVDPRIPPPFSLAEILMEVYKKSADSLRKFFKIIIVDDPEILLTNQTTKLTDIKEKYEAYCFVNDYKPLTISYQKKALSTLHFDISTQSDSNTEVFKQIRFKTHNEKSKQAKARNVSNEDSLSFFVRSECVITTFEDDYIMVKDFEERYNKFNDKHGARNVTLPTKRNMAQMGVQFERLTLNVIKPSDGEYKLELYRSNEVIFNQGTQNGSIEPLYWIGDAFVTVCIHIIIMLILLFPINFVMIYEQDTHSKMTTRPLDQFITASDVMQRPWELLEKADNLTTYVWVFIGFDVVMVAFMLIELLCYYSTRKFPFQNGLMEYSNYIRQFIQGTIFVLLFLVVGVASCYITVGVCWIVLGAVLNPEIYLPYASMILVLTAFLLIQIFHAVMAYKDLKMEVRENLTEKMRSMLEETLDKIIDKLQNPREIGAAIARGRYVHALNKTALGSFFSSLEIDPEMINALANKDPKAIQLITDQFGVDPIIVEALLAAVTRDLSSLQAALPRLAELPGIDLPPEIVKTIVMLAWKTNEVNLRTSVKYAVIQFTRHMNKIYKQKKREQEDRKALNVKRDESEPEDITQYHDIEIEPQVIEALVGMARGNPERLLDFLKNDQRDEKLPEEISLVMDFIKSYWEGDQIYVRTLIELLVHFKVMGKNVVVGMGKNLAEAWGKNLTQGMGKNLAEGLGKQAEDMEKKAEDKAKNLAKGLGCLISKEYHKYCVQKNMKEESDDQTPPPRSGPPSRHGPPSRNGDSEDDESGFSEEIDDFLKALGYTDSLIVQVIMILTRRERGTLQRILPKLVKFLNNGLGWRLDPDMMKSLFTMINGTKKESQKSGFWGINEDVISCFSSLMLCPVLELDKENEAEEEIKQTALLASNVTDPNSAHAHSPSPKATGTFNSDLYQTDLEAQDTARSNAGLRNSKSMKGKVQTEKRFQSGVFKKLSEFEDTHEEENPSVEILRYTYMQPTGDTMKWFEKNLWKLHKKVVMGLFVILRYPQALHDDYLDYMTRHLCRITNLDLKQADYCASLVKLITSNDQNTFRTAIKAFRKIKLPELSAVAKRFIDPCDLSLALWKHLGFGPEHNLSKMKQILKWDKFPYLCVDWCKAVAIEIQQKSPLQAREKVWATSQLLMAAQVPTMFIKKLLKSKCSDDTQISDFITLIKANYIKTMHPSSKKNAIEAISRLLDVPQDQMKAFVNIALCPVMEDRKPFMVELLLASGMDPSKFQKIQTIVDDGKNHLENVWDSVKDFENIGKLLGVPPVFIESLCPRMVKQMKQRPEILKRFIVKFTKEFGVKNTLMQDSIHAFCTKNIAEASVFAEQGLELEVGHLQTAIYLFGTKHYRQQRDVVGKIMRKFGAPAHSQQIAQAFVTLMSQQKDIGINVRRKKGKKKARFANPAQILGLKLGISPHIFYGLLSSIKNDEKGVKQAIIDLCKERKGQFQMDEGHCRGFISIASGQIDNIEDIANQIRFDTDIAEVFVLLAGSNISNKSTQSNSNILSANNLTHSKLKSSVDFQKFCLKLGLEMKKMAALIALTKQDIEHAEEICKDLGEIRGFHPTLIKALMSVYQYSTFSGKQHARYDPINKNELIKENIESLMNLYEINDLDSASFIIGLVQGNAGVVADISEAYFHWSTTEIGTYGSLVALYHKSKLVSNANEDGEDTAFSWLSYKDLKEVCNHIGQLFKVNTKGVQKIVQLAQKDKDELDWLQKELNLEGKRGKTDAKTLIKMIVYNKNYESDDDDIDVEDEEDLDEMDSGSDTSSKWGSNEDDQEGTNELTPLTIGLTDIDAFIKANQHNHISQTQEYLTQFTDILNELYKPHKHKEEKFTEEIIRLLFTLAKGAWPLTGFEQIFKQRTATENDDENEKGENNAADNDNNDSKTIDFQIAMEMLAITSGNHFNVLEVHKGSSGNDDDQGDEDNDEDQEEDKNNEEEDKKEQEQANKSDSLYAHDKIDIDPEKYQMRFLMQLASGDRKWLSISKTDKNASAIIGKRIQPLSVAQAIFGLISLDPYSLQYNLEDLTKILDIDIDMAQTLIYLSSQAINETSNGVMPLAERLDVETTMLDGFVAMANPKISDSKKAVESLCSRLNIYPPTAVNAIFEILQGDMEKGWSKMLNLTIKEPVSDPSANIQATKVRTKQKSSKPTNSQADLVTKDSQASQKEKKESEDKKKHKDDRRDILVQFIKILQGNWDIRLYNGINDQMDWTKILEKKPKKIKGVEQRSTRQLLVETLGLNELFKDKKSKDTDKKLLSVYTGLKEPQKAKIPEILLDMLIGIATNDSFSSVVEPILALFYEPLPQEHMELMPALIQLYNKNDSKLAKAAKTVEDFIQDNQHTPLPIPIGLMMSIYGSTRAENKLMALGVTRFLKSDQGKNLAMESLGKYVAQDDLGKQFGVDMMRRQTTYDIRGIQAAVSIEKRVPLFLYKMSTNKGFKYKQDPKFEAAANFVIKQFLHSDELKQMPESVETQKKIKYCKKIFYSLTSSRIKEFIKHIHRKAYYKKSDLLELYYMIKQKLPKNARDKAAEEAKAQADATAQEPEAPAHAVVPDDQVAEVAVNFPKISQRIADSQNIEPKVVNALLNIITTQDVSMEGRKGGMGNDLYELVNFFIEKIKFSADQEEKLKRRKEKAVEEDKTQEEAKQPEEEKKQEETHIIKLIDAFFLSCHDPYVYKKNILSNMDVLGEVMLGVVPDEAIYLLQGIVQLFGAEGNAQMKNGAIINLHKAFDVPKRIVQGLVGMAKGDWHAMERMVAYICEFDSHKIQSIVLLIKRLRIAKEADDMEGKEERQAQQYIQLRERIAQGADVVSIYNMLDADGTGMLDFDEFSEALKYYGLHMTMERKIEIFSKFDIDNSTDLSIQEFDHAIEYIKDTISADAIESIGLSVSNITKTVLIALFILLLLFMFIFLGISGFTTNTTLGTVVNSILPIFAGAIVFNASSLEVADNYRRIAPSIDRAITILTVSDA